jgi:hypothetical protein
MNHKFKIGSIASIVNTDNLCLILSFDTIRKSIASNRTTVGNTISYIINKYKLLEYAIYDNEIIF